MKSHIVSLIADEEKVDYFINRQWDLAPFIKEIFPPLVLLSPEYWFEPRIVSIGKQVSLKFLAEVRIENHQL